MVVSVLQGMYAVGFRVGPALQLEAKVLEAWYCDGGSTRWERFVSCRGTFLGIFQER